MEMSFWQRPEFSENHKIGFPIRSEMTDLRCCDLHIVFAGHNTYESKIDRKNTECRNPMKQNAPPVPSVRRTGNIYATSADVILHCRRQADRPRNEDGLALNARAVTLNG